MDPRLTTLLVGQEDATAIGGVLDRLLAETAATYVMLLDQSGQVIVVRGTTGGRRITALGGLLAGTFASSREVARMMEEQDFRVLFQQGARESLFMRLIEEQWLLVVVFGGRTPVGLVKVLTLRTETDLLAILRRVRETRTRQTENLRGQLRGAAGPAVDGFFRD